MSRGIALGIALWIGIAVIGPHAYGQDKGPTTVLTDTFEADSGGWMALGPHARVEQATEAADVKSGKGSLRFRYSIGERPGEKAPTPQGGLPADVLLRPTPDSQLAKMQALGFWARSDIAAPFIVTLSEKGGGRYVTIVWLPAGQWQHATLRPSDFWLADDKTDPPDPDGKLDLDQVENIGLVNIWSFFALSAGDTPESIAVFAPLLGPHTLLLDDFTIYAAAPPIEATRSPGLCLAGLRCVPPPTPRSKAALSGWTTPRARARLWRSGTTCTASTWRNRTA
jgi:hypothetical protein